MSDKITFDAINNFYQFLQGKCPDTIKLKDDNQPKMSPQKAFAIIYYLQEHFRVFPDVIEKCDNCGDLYDSYYEGFHSEKTGKFYCESCSEFNT